MNAAFRAVSAAKRAGAIVSGPLSASRGLLFLLASLALVSMLLNLLPVFAFGLTIDFVIHRHSIDNLEALVVLMVSGLFLEVVIDFVSVKIIAYLRRHCVAQIHDSMLGALEHAPLEMLEREPTAVIGRRFRSVDKLVKFKLDWARRVRAVPVYAALILFYSMRKSAALGLCMVVMTALFVVVHWHLNRKLKAVVADESKASDALTRKLTEFVSGLVTLRIGKSVQQFRTVFQQEQDASFELAKKRSALIAALKLLTDLYTRTAVIVLLAVGALLVLRHQITAGTLVSVNLAFRRALAEIRGVVPLFQRKAEIDHEAALIDELVGRLAAPPDCGTHHLVVPAFSLVKLDKVGYRYRDASIDSIRNVSFQFKAGDTVALIGESGAGKSSLLKVLSGLYTPTSGAVHYLGGEEGQHVSVSLTEANEFIFSGSIRRNITLGQPVPDKQIDAATRFAIADQFIARLTKGLDAELREQGSNLSQGQRQRITLARAFSRDAALIALDEPTSALDVETETAFLANLARLKRVKTIVLATHRVAPALQADVVVMLSRGTVLEWGKTADLIADPSSIFSAWVTAQRFIEADCGGVRA